MDMELEERSRLLLERLLLFCDAVFAIAITLLVLEIKVPELEVASESGLREALSHLVPKIGGYVASFLVVGSYWAKHHKLFSWVRRYDERLLWPSLQLLLLVSFLPFPTAFFSEYMPFRSPLILYAVSLGLLGLASFRLARVALSVPGLLDPAVRREEAIWLCRSTLGPSVMCALAIGLSFWSLSLARWALVLIPVVVWWLSRQTRRAGQLEDGGGAQSSSPED
jgi:uncharacterized membrane protein